MGNLVPPEILGKRVLGQARDLLVGKCKLPFMGRLGPTALVVERLSRKIGGRLIDERSFALVREFGIPDMSIKVTDLMQLISQRILMMEQRAGGLMTRAEPCDDRDSAGQSRMRGSEIRRIWRGVVSSIEVMG
jgi:hypothetical protein